tara:strand:+ start:113 stop:499 length:387 start_codon:yes stop_codon:yes gene_type:complete
MGEMNGFYVGLVCQVATSLEHTDWIDCEIIDVGRLPSSDWTIMVPGYRSPKRDGSWQVREKHLRRKPEDDVGSWDEIAKIIGHDVREPEKVPVLTDTLDELDRLRLEAEKLLREMGIRDPGRFFIKRG